MVKLAHLPWIIVVVAGFVFLTPRAADMGSTESAIVPTDKAPAESQSFNWYGGETTLERQPDGHFYVDASVDGTPVHFLVDTGASIVALTGDDAYELGLHWAEDQVRPIGHGASGPVRGVPVTLGQIELGGFRTDQVQAVIIPEGLQISLLGQSFLSGIGNVEIAGDQMVLGAGH